MRKHFVEFFSPGTFVSESSIVEIDSWDVNKAIEIAKTIKERHDATPYGFLFITRERNDDELDSKITNKSNMYFLGGKIETIEEIEKRNLPEERILISNMKCNDWDKVITNTNSWKITLPFEKDDILLQF